MTPREAALEFIRPYVERGTTIAWLKRRLTGRYQDGNRVQLGGYLWEGETAERLTRSEVAVTEFGGEPCLHLYDLVALYRELYQRQQPGLFDQEGKPVSSL
jgi:hypothetical protein